ncbi:SET domain-containing protein-lysine N-methyltransferase [soil metagenome]
MPMLDGLRIVQSKIHGYGGIATRPFKKGERIVYGDGILYREDDDFDDTYALIVDGEASGKGDVLFWDLTCQTRWFNHSCEPNSEVCSEWDAANDTLSAWWIALRDIEPGEEILYDYGFAAEVAEVCHCGAKTCRGLIVDDDPENLAKLPPELKKHLKIPAAPRVAV